MSEVAQQHPFAKPQRNRRLLSIVLISGAVLLLIIGVIFYTRSRRSGIIVSGPTTGFTITLNGRPVVTQTTEKGLYIAVYSGRYRLKIDRPSYSSYTADISVPSGKDVLVRPTFVLLPSSSATAQQGIDYVRTSPDQKTLYYLGDGRRHLYRLEVGSQAPIKLTDQPLSGVEDLQWSNDPNVAILVLSDGVYLHEIPKFDFEHQQLLKIGGSEIISPVWDPSGTGRIGAAYFTQQGERSLVVAHKPFDPIDRKADLKGFTDPKLIWSPDGRYILVINRSATAAANNIWIYSLEKATFEQLTTTGNALNASFNSDSSAFVYERLPLSNEQGDRVLVAYSLGNKTEKPLSLQAPLSEATWKDASHLLVDEPTTHNLVLVGLDGSTQSENFTFPGDIRGMSYFTPSTTLIYYTKDTIYSVGLDK